jgi:hypothetical protein
MGYLRCDIRGIYFTCTYLRSRNSQKKSHLDGITNFLRGCYVFFHQEFHRSNRHLSQKTIGSYVHKSRDEVPYSSLHSRHAFIAVSIFATMMLAAAGSYRRVYFFLEIQMSIKHSRRIIIYNRCNIFIFYMLYFVAKKLFTSTTVLSSHRNSMCLWMVNLYVNQRNTITTIR